MFFPPPLQRPLGSTPQCRKGPLYTLRDRGHAAVGRAEAPFSRERHVRNLPSTSPPQHLRTATGGSRGPQRTVKERCVCAGADTRGAEAGAPNREFRPQRGPSQPSLFVLKDHHLGSVNSRQDNCGADLLRHLQQGLPGERRGQTFLRIGKLCVHGRAGDVAAGQAGQAAADADRLE